MRSDGGQLNGEYDSGGVSEGGGRSASSMRPTPRSIRVKVVGHFPNDSHPAIIYPVALTATAKPEASNYFAFMRSDVAKMIFEKYGFSFLIKPAS
jgi:hypothetical protein